MEYDAPFKSIHGLELCKTTTFVKDGLWDI